MKFLQVKILIKKIIIVVLVLAIQLTGLGLFYVNQDFVYNFKTSYLSKIYLPLAKYELNNIEYLAKVVGGEINNVDQAKSIPILLYHGVIAEDDGYNTTIDNFKDQMFTLKAAGWQTISLNDYQSFMQGDKNLPAKSFLLTFDDARKDSYYPAEPFLKVFDYQAVMFVITKYSLGEENIFFLNKKELKKMVASSHWNIQSHSHLAHDYYQINDRGDTGYYYTDRLWLAEQNRNETKHEFEQRVKEDLNKASQILEQELDIKVTALAYPFGEFGQNKGNYSAAQDVVIAEASQVYPLTFYQSWHKSVKNNYPQAGSFLSRRIDVLSDWNGRDLLNQLEQGLDKNLPYNDNFSENNGWLSVWGGIEIIDNKLYLKSKENKDGAISILNGSYSWSDYTVTAELEQSQADSFSLLSNYFDEQYYSCNFNQNSIAIYKYKSSENDKVDKKELLVSTNKSGLSLLDNKRNTVGMTTKKNKISCQINGQDILIVNLGGNEVKAGGIGIKIWSDENRPAAVSIKSISVFEAE